MPKKRRRIRVSGSSVRERARPYVSLIYAGKKLGKAREKQLKTESRPVIIQVLRSAGTRGAKLLGNPRPSELNELADPIPVAAADDLLDELNWAHAVLCYHAAEINTFLGYLDKFERSLLIGDYTAADAIRTRSIADLGSSWWAVETDFILAQKRYGLEGNRELLNSYNDEKLRDWVKYLCHPYSLRVEDTLPCDDFDRFYDLLQDIQSDDSSRDVFAYVRFRVNHHHFRDLDRLGPILSVEESHSLIDRYCTFVKAIQFLVAGSDSLKMPRIKQILSSIVEVIRDPRLIAAAGLDDPAVIKRTSVNDILYAVLDQYTQGDYSKAAESALEWLPRYPGCFDLYQLAASSLIRGEVDLSNPFNSDSIASELFQKIHSVSCRNGDTSDNLRRLYKLSYQLDAVPLGAQIYAFVKKQEGEQRGRGKSFYDYAVTGDTPRQSSLIDDHDAALSYLARLGNLYPGNAAVALFTAVRQSLKSRHEFIPAERLPESRVWKYRAHVREELRLYDEALEAYRNLDRLAHGEVTLKAAATTGQYRCFLKLGRVLESARILAEAAAVNPWLVSRAIVLEVLERYPECRDKNWLQELSWPALHVMAQREGYAKFDSDQLHDVLDEFLSAHGLNKPSGLRAIAHSFSTPTLIVFLSGICTPEVLQSSVWYDTQEAVERERIIICEWLVELNPERRAVYVHEIAELTGRASMRDLTHTVGQNKIYVDTEAIKANLSQGVTDRAMRCLTFIGLRSELRETLEVANFAPEDVKNVKIILVDGAFRLFAQLFNEIKDLFIYSNEYGLDSNLSQRIRHGTLLGAIRAEFEHFHLLTPKDSSGVYRDNNHWLPRMSEPGESSSEAPGEAFRTLSQAVDALAHEVRAEWIQIKGHMNDNKGMFDYEFTDSQIQQVYESLEGVTSVDSLVDGMIDILWQRTEADLESVRCAITGRLKDEFVEALDRCQQSLESALSWDRVAEFRTALTSCKTQLARGLASISEWFRVDRAQRMRSFRISELIDTALQIATRYCRPSHLDVTKTVTVPFLIHGNVFRPLFDLLFILLDNIAKHAQVSPVAVDLNIEEINGSLHIVLTNELGANVDVTAIEDKASVMSRKNVLNNEWDLLRREGGSGFMKIHKILRYELRCEQYDVKLRVSDARRFSAALVIPLRGLLDESTSGR
jgi:tetratricopeptide (TPR) repeat protein